MNEALRSATVFPVVVSVDFALVKAWMARPAELTSFAMSCANKGVIVSSHFPLREGFGKSFVLCRFRSTAGSDRRMRMSGCW